MKHPYTVTEDSPSGPFDCFICARPLGPGRCFRVEREPAYFIRACSRNCALDTADRMAERFGETASPVTFTAGASR
jgi:hypothetical protein